MPEKASKTSSNELLQEKLSTLLHKDVLNIFRQSFSSFTKVQLHTGVKLLAHEDVVVESPTGSGKTHAFLLPAFTIMKRRPKWEKNEIGLLIICPSRDLALQIEKVASPYCEALGFALHATVGGKKMDTDIAKIREGVNVLVATPGRLERLIEGERKDQPVLRKMIKSVEILIVDEADRFSESSFSTSMATILEQIPKQRRTGLFSATQAKDKVDLAMFTLRSANFIKLADKKDAVAPSSLSVFYSDISADQKLMALVEFIRSVPDKKVLVFFSSCQCVQYFSLILPHIIKKRKILAVHGKNKKNRFKQVEKFREAGPTVMLSTDLMARGIDIPDLDWVVHFDIPKRSSWLVHRAGRAGRNGREGASLLLLTPQQTAYATFIKEHEKLVMKEKRIPTVTELKSEQLRAKIVKMASMDRRTLEAGTAAFISFVQAQGKHDSFVVCKLSEVDLVGHAHAYGLLRMPKIKETIERDVSDFKRSDVDTSAIPFKSAADELKRKKLRERNIRKRDEFKSKEKQNDEGKKVKAPKKVKKDGKTVKAGKAEVGEKRKTSHDFSSTPMKAKKRKVSE